MEGTGRQRSLVIVLVWLTLGLTLAGIWTDVVGYSVNLLPQSADATPVAFNRDAFLWGRLLTGILMIAFARFIPRVQTVLAVSVALAMSFSTGVIIISYHQTLLPPDILSSVGIFVTGCGYVFLVSLFYIHFAKRIETTYVVISIAISLVCETVFSIVISLYCAPIAQICIVAAAPLLSMACYFLARFSSRGLAPLGMPVRVEGFGRYVLLAEVVVFAVLLVLIRGLSNIGIWGRDRTNFTGMMELSVGELVLISLFVLALTYLVFILPRKCFSLQMRCLIGFAVLLAGLQILALTDDFHLGYFFDTVTTATELFTHLVYWMVIIDCIRRTDVPPFRVVALSRPVYAVVSLAWIHYFEQAHFVTSTFVMVFIYVLFLVVFVALFSGRISKGLFSRGGEDTRQHSDLMAFAQRHRLSQRESQIFELLMEGKKRSEIEAICGLSEGTIKTHITNIYRKLDVHSKSDMASLFKKEAHSADGQAADGSGLS